MKKTIKAFTLVELIVVIVILAILGAIAFISFQGYSRNSRDSVRIADINSVKKSLELFITKTGFYPDPDNAGTITYNGAIVWKEGTLGDTVTRNLEKLDKKVIDPLTSNEYTYSVTNTKTEYQIGAISEMGGLSSNYVEKTYALDLSKSNVVAYIGGTYNEKFIKVKTGSIDLILAQPSIIVTDITDINLSNILTSKKLVYGDYKNIPHSYNTPGTGGFNFDISNPVLFSGTLNELFDDDKKVEFMTNLKDAYNGTILSEAPIYRGLMETDTTRDLTNAVNEVNKYINSNIGGIGNAKIEKIAMINIKCGAGYKIVNGSCVEDSIQSTCTGLPTNAHWNSVSTITQTKNGEQWLPSTNGTYNTEESTDECRFICSEGYAWNGSNCVSDVCSGSIPTNATSNATSTGYGSGRTYNTTAGKCTFGCNSGYSRISGACTAMLYGGTHSASQCTSAGGSVVSAGGVNICKFDVYFIYNVTGPTVVCPGTGWNKYLNRSTTVRATCGGANTCSTAYHAWGNVVREQCTFASTYICKATVDYLGCY
ncbi:MAG: type II secretion system protein [Candidatus Gracilibacteria bacterium]|nr:type II secretion system protein [Candidatus Gracilibacteria bacterium]